MSYHPRRTTFADLAPAQQAGILCNDPQFQRFAAIRCGAPGDLFNATASAEYLRNICRIKSRRELADNEEAQLRFQKLRTDFDAWAGRIAQPR